MSKLRPWPIDAVMIVAADEGREIRQQMESVVYVRCRKCKRKLAADSYSIRKAHHLPSRRGRPVLFFCVDCCLKHEPSTIAEMHDDRGRFPCAYA